MELMRPDQFDAAARTLGEAFFHDPLLQIVAPDEGRRKRIASWFMSRPLLYAMRWGRAWCNEDATAVAGWLPPGATDMTPLRMLRAGMASVPLKVGLGGARRFVRALSATEKFHKAVQGPHWYLLVVGTSPNVQGTGLGSQLVEMGASQADEAGIPCYLETATDSNVAYYRKRGFEVTGEAEVYGFTLRGMVRQPR